MSLLIILNIISSNPIPSAEPFTAEMVAAGYGGMAAGYMMTAAGSIMAAALLAKGKLFVSCQHLHPYQLSDQSVRAMIK